MTDLIVKLIHMASDFVMTTFPTLDIAADTVGQIAESVSFLMGFFADVNYIVPLSDFALIVSAWLALKLASITLFGANWVIRRVFDVIP